LQRGPILPYEKIYEVLRYLHENELTITNNNQNSFTVDQIKYIQLALENFGFYKGPIDGDYGGATARAVEEFQRFLIPGQVDGEFGPVTAWHLYRRLKGDEINLVAPTQDYNGEFDL
jgi:peptidoglycan hydrolase-like protein with peptidoglycan-binding domain